MKQMKKRVTRVLALFVIAILLVTNTRYTITTDAADEVVNIRVTIYDRNYDAETPICTYTENVVVQQEQTQDGLLYKGALPLPTQEMIEQQNPGYVNTLVTSQKSMTDFTVDYDNCNNVDDLYMMTYRERNGNNVEMCGIKDHGYFEVTNNSGGRVTNEYTVGSEFNYELEFNSVPSGTVDIALYYVEATAKSAVVSFSHGQEFGYNEGARTWNEGWCENLTATVPIDFEFTMPQDYLKLYGWRTTDADGINMSEQIIDELPIRYTSSTEYYYVYPAFSQEITIRCVDEDGNKIAKDTKRECVVDHTYTIPSKEIAGYTLKKTPQNASGTVTMEKEIGTVTFVYAPNSYDITYDLDGGTLVADKANPTSYNIASNTIVLNNPTKEGYDFLGWTGSNGTTPSTEVTIKKGTTGNLSYKANWAEKPAENVAPDDEDDKDDNDNNDDNNDKDVNDNKVDQEENLVAQMLKAGIQNLVKGAKYSFAAGTKYQVAGDETIYQGGIDFYVASDGEYQFTVVEK